MDDAILNSIVNLRGAIRSLDSSNNERVTHWRVTMNKVLDEMVDQLKDA